MNLNSMISDNKLIVTEKTKFPPFSISDIYLLQSLDILLFVSTSKLSVKILLLCWTLMCKKFILTI